MANGYERAANEIVPAARIVIARQLKERYNMTESSIAAVLGVAQAAVSKYLNKPPSKAVEAACSGIDHSQISPRLESISKGDQEELKQCICTICNSMNKFDCRFSYVKEAAKA